MRKKIQRVPVRKKSAEAQWNKTIGDVLIIMLSLPVKVLSEEYSWDNTRLGQLVEDISDAYETICADQIDFDTVMTSLTEESGIVIKDIFEKHNVLSTKKDVGFMLTCSLSVMLLMDTQGFTDEQAKEYAEQLVRYYDWVRKGYTTIYDLRQCLKAHTGITVTHADKNG